MKINYTDFQGINMAIRELNDICIWIKILKPNYEIS